MRGSWIKTGRPVMKKNNSVARGAKPTRAKASSADVLGPNSEIGRKLKQYYDELVSHEVPDRFAELLGQLERAEPATHVEATEPKAEG